MARRSPKPEPTIPSGLYTAEVVKVKPAERREIRPAEKVEQRTDGAPTVIFTSGPGYHQEEKLIWTFDLEVDGRKVRLTGRTIGEVQKRGLHGLDPRSKALTWASSVLQRNVGPRDLDGWDDLVGRACIVEVSQPRKGSRVVDVLPASMPSESSERSP